MTSSYDDLWKCSWCGEHFAVPSLAEDHRKVCPLRPAD